MTTAKVKIITDSTCDMTQSEIEALGAVMVPLSVAFGPEVYYNGQLSPDQYWEKAQGPFWPKTSQPSAGAFEEAFGAQVEAGYEVVCLTLTAHHSGTFGNATAVARKFGGMVSVVDSRSVSTGLAWQVMDAAKAAAEGWERQEIVTMVEGMGERTRLFAALDTIENVRRGGRVSMLMPLLDRLMGVLDLKTVLTMAGGQLGLLTAARSFEGAITRVRDAAMAHAPLERIAILHTRVPEKASAFGDLLAEMAGLEREGVRVVEAGPVLACHAGPRVIGAFVLSKSA
jgi:DegV family protein with EDD domain